MRAHNALSRSNLVSQGRYVHRGRVVLCWGNNANLSQGARAPEGRQKRYMLDRLLRGRNMQMKKIREIANWKDVVSGTMKKKELIRSIQEKEGNSPCFRTAQASCQQYGCWWRLDCKPGEIKLLSQYSGSQ